jgi:hypothetical protein
LAGLVDRAHHRTPNGGAEIPLVSCPSLSKLRNAAQAGAVGWWRRRTASPAKPDPVRRTGVVSCAVVIGSLVLARVIAATGSRLLLALVFMVFVIAAITLFAVVIIRCQEWANEMDAADPLPVRNRGVIARTLRLYRSNAIASAGRVSRAWLYSAAPVATGLPSRFASVVAVLRREVTRDKVRQWLRVTTDALSGIPPPDVSPPAEASEGERASTPVGAVYGDAQSGLASPDSPDLRLGNPVRQSGASGS